MKSLNFLIGLVTLFFLSPYALFAQQIEQTDSTIASIVYPEKDLKLWYGSDDFRVDRFVILPKYTLLYNNELSIFRLLDNQENLVRDEARLLAIKSIKPYLVKFQNEQKWALGPATTWFMILNDSTVAAGTALFSGRREVAGYLMITIKNDKLVVEHKQFTLDAETDNIQPNNMQFITNYADYKGAQFYSSTILLSPTPKNKFIVSESLYLKTIGKPLSIYLAQKADVPEPASKRMLLPVQLISDADRLLIYDPKTEILRLITTDIGNPVVLNISNALPDNVPKGRKFSREFMIDRVTNRLYYKILTFSNETTDQLVMRVNLKADKFTLDPVLRSGMTGYYSTYINNGKLFFHDSKRGYIYVTKTDLP